MIKVIEGDIKRRNDVKYIVVGQNGYSYAQSIVGSLKKRGQEVIFYQLEDFKYGMSYLEKKLNKFRESTARKQFIFKWENRLIEICQINQPDMILFLAGDGLTEDLLKLLKPYHKILWLWDSIRRDEFSRLEQFIPYFRDVLCFEYEDINYLRNKYPKIHYEYLPLGYDADIFKKGAAVRDLDISFIGFPYEGRKKIIENIAKEVFFRGGRMYIGGPWHGNHFWKKWQFRRKYPYTAKYLDNGKIDAQTAAEVYTHSKICLNINNEAHKSLNPRTFEILATNSLCLMNKGQDAHGLINLDSDLAEYIDEDDLLKKIAYYLNNDVERENIAECGYNAIHNYSMDKMIEKILQVKK